MTAEKWCKVLKLSGTTHSHVVVIDGLVDLPPGVFHIVIINIFVDFLGFLYCLQKSNVPSKRLVSLTPSPVQTSSWCHQPPEQEIMPSKLRCRDWNDRFCGLVAFRDPARVRMDI